MPLPQLLVLLLQLLVILHEPGDLELALGQLPLKVLNVSFIVELLELYKSDEKRLYLDGVDDLGEEVLRLGEVVGDPTQVVFVPDVEAAAHDFLAHDAGLVLEVGSVCLFSVVVCTYTSRGSTLRSRNTRTPPSSALASLHTW